MRALPRAAVRRGAGADVRRRRHRLHGRGRRRDPRAGRSRRELWDALLDAGVVPAGLGARDTLRLEAGLPLHGHELGPGITPLQAGLGWVVRFDKGDFRGRGAARGRARSGRRRAACAGMTIEGRQPPREGAIVLARRRDRRRGHERQLLTRARPRHRAGLPRSRDRPGTDVEIDIRGRTLAATVVETAVRPPLSRSADRAGQGLSRSSRGAMRTATTRSVRKLATRSLQLDSRCTRLFEGRTS